MTLETAEELYEKLEGDNTVQNYYSHANARYVYFEVKEPVSDVLRTDLNFASDSLAFSYLDIGCTFFENQDNNESARRSLEKAATFIEYNHFSAQNHQALSPYYLLISGLAYYSASQYSKAFIIMKESETYATDIAKLTSSFLRKDFTTVRILLNEVLLDDGYVERGGDEQTIDDRVQVVIFAKAFANLIDFLFFGIRESLDKALEMFNDLSRLLEIEREPSLWWIVRLLRIIVRGFEKSSLWTTILPLIPDDQKGLTTRFINNLVFGKKSIIELFVVQRKALSKVLAPEGAVVSLPTSSGKTRIAEIAILQCLSDYEDAKILYLAPFRSLAYEVENSLNEAFESIDITVSQLYGNGNFSQLDKSIIEDTQILIATPEKAKMILRANSEIANSIKLVVIDEGHLLDTSKRNVTNEIFIEELKHLVFKNEGKIILLSAVLPNTEDIAQWVCRNREAYVSDKERMARQRTGTMEFYRDRSSVTLRWRDEEKSFNPNFIKPFKPPRKRNQRPNNIKEAIAYTALKLSIEKPLLIFIANARSVLTQARVIKEAMGFKDQLKIHSWINSDDWHKVKLICEENQSKENKEILEFANYGIVCHKGNLNQEIRLALETLMRRGNPRIIIATMTLGQGVNLGVSTVIFAGVKYYAGSSQYITPKDFWNIVGRAGRAFIDTEGKILYATQNPQDIEDANRYFGQQPKNAISGLLTKIITLSRIAKKCKIKFSDFLELIAENDFSEFSKFYFIKSGVHVDEDFQNFFDWIDDTLLSLEIHLEDKSIDDLLRESLAYIQAEEYTSLDIKGDDVLAFLQARSKAIKEKLVPDPSKRKMLVSLGLPLASAIKVDNTFEVLIAATTAYSDSEKSMVDKLNLLIEIEAVMEGLPSPTFHQIYDSADIETVQEKWLSGENVYELEDIKNTDRIVKNYLAYTVPWFLGAAANICRIKEEEDAAEILEELAVCCELGLPNYRAVKIYLTGISSRVASIEISNLELFEDISEDRKVSFFRFFIDSNLEEIKDDVEQNLTKKWLSIFEITQKRKKKKRKVSFPDFEFSDSVQKMKSNRLYLKLFGGELYLCSADYEDKVLIDDTSELPFSKLSDSPNVYFESIRGKKWSMRVG